MAIEPPVDRAQEFWLAQPTETFRLGTGDLAKRVRRLESDARNSRAQMYVAAFFNVTMWTAFFILMPYPGARAGSLMALLGWTYVLQQVTLHSRRTIATCLDMAEMPVISFIRESLERDRGFFSGARFWLRLLSMIAGPVVFCLGVGISETHGLVIGLLVAVAWIALSALAIPGRKTKLKQIQKQLDELRLYEGAKR